MREEFMHLWIHDDAVIANIVGGEIASREKLHHWPLSYVEKVSLADGRAYVYKSQSSSCSVEPAFLRSAHAPFILSPIWHAAHDGCDALLFPFIDLPGMPILPREDLIQTVRGLSEKMQTLSDAPVFLDYSTAQKFADACFTAFEILRESDLPADESPLARWLERDAPHLYQDAAIGLVHGDLTGRNLLYDGDTMRYIIDWQRPMKAPLHCEVALSLRSSTHIAPQTDGFAKMACLCHFIWYAQASKHYLPLPGMANHAWDLLKEFEGMLA